jgi:hypothetical protein
VIWASGVKWPIERVVLVTGRRTAGAYRHLGHRRSVSELHDYPGFAGALSYALDAKLQISPSLRRLETSSDAATLGICPWPVACRWFDSGRADASRWVVIDADERSLLQRAAGWHLLAGVSSVALSWWSNPLPFSYPSLVGQAVLAQQIGGVPVEPDPVTDGYLSFRVSNGLDTATLLARYLRAAALLPPLTSQD